MKSIVLVEDNADSRFMMTSLMQKAGYNVLALEDGRPVLDEGFSVPDLFLLDIDVPLIDGIALCKYLKLKDQTRTIPVIVISGNAELQSRAERAGADGFLHKPLNAHKLLHALHTVFAGTNRIVAQPGR